ncbi:unknown protein [Microcystis aeruginosa NIES-843]|uniref:Uncharacterized protein n=1 Tax=Microcystis aeruginosa (strain NIES-843 / IAM M-2473) TaxID=449447 RepID=B0JQ12_MICAN|nr:unknown protein [Microcystis aeruginosa NIES-843]
MLIARRWLAFFSLSPSCFLDMSKNFCFIFLGLLLINNLHLSALAETVLRFFGFCYAMEGGYKG